MSSTELGLFLVQSWAKVSATPEIGNWTTAPERGYRGTKGKPVVFVRVWFCALVFSSSTGPCL